MKSRGASAELSLSKVALVPCVQSLSCVQLFAMDCGPPGSSVHRISQASIQHGLPFPPPGDLPGPGIKPRLLPLLHWQADP